MSKVSHKIFRNVPLTATTDQIIGTLDVTNCNGFSVQINGITGTAGTMKVQRSNDNETWEDITGATATLAANVAKGITVTDLYFGHVRVLVTLSGGAGNYNFFFLGKEH